MKSIRNHLQLGLAISSVFLIAALWVANNHALRTLFSQIVISRLNHDADALLQLVDLSNPQATSLAKQLPPIYSQPLSGHYFAIQISPDRILYSPSLWESSFDFPAVAPGETKDFKISGPDRQFLRGIVKSYLIGGNNITIAVAEDLSDVHEQRIEYKQMLITISLLGFILLLAVQSGIIRHIMRRLAFVQQEVKEIHEGDRSALSAIAPQEIQPLVTTFNQLLKLLQDRLDRSRRSVSNLAHALNTPLSYLVQYFDLPSNKITDTQSMTAREQTRQIEFLIQRELKRARLSGHSISSQKFDPADDVPELIALLKLSHKDKALEFNFGLDKRTRPFGDREDMLELIGNVLDNACKWANTQVDVTITGNRPVKIEIDDDGPGVPAAKIPHLGQRGLRLDEGVEGHGLGLAISREIVDVYGGEISFLPSGLGGLGVRITLK